MIIQKLNDLYARLASDPDSKLPVPGYSVQKVTFEIVLDKKGNLISINDYREEEGKKKRARNMNLPGQAKPSGSGINPCFLWDNSAYMLGYKFGDDKPERTALAFEAFKNKHLSIESKIDDEAFSSVCRFLETWDSLVGASGFEEVLNEAAVTGFGIFRLQGEKKYVHDSPKVKKWLESQTSAIAGNVTGQCLVSGEVAPIAQLHEPAIKGISGAQATGAKIVSFNCKSFTSYGKDQGFNAPVSEAVAFKYGTALNELLANEKHRIRLNDTTVVFWTEKQTVFEEKFGSAFGGSGKESVQDEVKLGRLKDFLEIVRKAGKGDLIEDSDTPFYILGLAPNAARISIRFWYPSTVKQIAQNLSRYHAQMELVKTGKDKDWQFVPLWLLLAQTAREMKGISPLLEGALMRSIIQGTPYPLAFVNQIIARIRADRKLDYPRIAPLKAYLIRNLKHDITMSLDLSNKTPGYLLGRLFAALEKTQSDALPGINAGLKDRFYGAASATPKAVFPRVLRTYVHHLGKLKDGQRINREKVVGSIMNSLADFPSHLNLEGQSFFALGYYHQMTDFYTKKESSEETSPIEQSNEQ